MFRPVPNGMLQVVPVVLKYIVMLVLYLPPCPPALRQQPRIIRSYRFIRYPTVMIGGLPILLIPYLKLKVIYPQPLLVISYLHLVRKDKTHPLVEYGLTRRVIGV
jgi:hypothetical protein